MDLAVNKELLYFLSILGVVVFRAIKNADNILVVQSMDNLYGNMHVEKESPRRM